jgi:hypothetical protein
VALALALAVAAPAEAADSGAVPPSTTPAASDEASSRQAVQDLLASSRSWLAAGPSTSGYAQPAAAEDDVVIYDRANLYFEIHVTLNGKTTPYEIGRQYARSMLRVMPGWPAAVYAYVTGATWETGLSYGTLVARATALKQTVSPEVRGYVEGMASVVREESWGLVNENDCWILNLFPDIARPTMCSAVGAWGRYTDGGKPILGRNLDWSNDFILPKLNALTVYHNGPKSFCSIGYIGLWNVISGFNKSGLYAGILDADTNQPYPALTDRHSYPMDLRTALETTGTIKAAAAVMTANKYCFNHQIVLADKTRVGVLENDQTSTGPLARTVRFDKTPLNAGIPTWDWPDSVCAINSFLSKGNNSALFGTKWNTDRWTRYRAQMKTVGKMTVAKTKDLLSYGGPDEKYWPYNELTTMMMVYQPTTGHLDIFMKPRSGGLPRNPAWQSIDVDWGQSMFAGRWVKTWPAPEGWTVGNAQVEAAPGGGVVAAAQVSTEAEEAVAVVRFRANGRVAWSRIIDPAGDADAHLAGLAVTREAVVVGATRASADGAGWLVKKYAADGGRGWTRSGAEAGHFDLLGDVVATADGGVIAGGGASAEAVGRGYRPATDWCVRKFSATGRQQWQRVIASTDAGWSEDVTAVALLGKDVVVTGTWAGHGEPFGCSMAVARLAANGTVRWQTELAPQGLSAPTASGLAARGSGIAVSGRDTVEVGDAVGRHGAATVDGTTGLRDAAGGGAAGLPAAGGRCAYRLDPATGVADWQYEQLPGGAGQATTFRDVTIDEYGNVTAVGALLDTVSGGQQGLVTWFGPDGTETSQTIGSEDGGGAAAAAVEAGEHGLTYVAATVTLEGSGRGMMTACWQPDGTIRWYTLRDSPECGALDVSVRGVKVFTVGTAGTRLVLGKYDTTTAPPAPMRLR